MMPAVGAWWPWNRVLRESSSVSAPTLPRPPWQTRQTAELPTFEIMTGWSLSWNESCALPVLRSAPVPALLYAPGTVRPDGSKSFGERSCQTGGMSRLPMRHLLPIALAHALKLNKFGA